MNNWENFCEEITRIYNDLGELDGGSPANYIPQLAKVNPKLFGVSVVSVSGEVFNIGDTSHRFCIQSCCKPMLYSLVLEEHGAERVSKHIGREPSGKSFNCLEFNSENKPHNPLINAGAIMAASLVRPDDRSDDRYDHIISEYKRIIGSDDIGFDNSVYLSEKNTASRNRALSHLMMENSIFPKNTSIDETLELYFQTCSITMTTQELAKFAGVLANSGRGLESGDVLISPHTVKDILCVMYSSGMYDYSGRWSFEVGLPAKSGVSGCIFVVIPGVCGICVFSPSLDSMGNSVRGVELFKRLAKRFRIHIFDTLVDGLDKKKSVTRHCANKKITKIYEYCKLGNSEKLGEILDDSDSDLDVNEGDYDDRRPLHIAVEENHIDCVKVLIKHGADPNLEDRWGVTPIGKAENEIRELLISDRN